MAHEVIISMEQFLIDIMPVKHTLKGPYLLLKKKIINQIRAKGPTSAISFVGHDGENAKIKSAG